MSKQPITFFNHSAMNAPKSQRGVALITALIITSVAVSLATLIIYRQQIQIRLSGNISTLEQNYQFAYGMEDFAGTILTRSFEEQPDFTSLNDIWHSEAGLVLPIKGGQMTGKLYDLHARINLNSLGRPRIKIKPEKPEGTGESETPSNTGDATEAEPEEDKYIDIAKVTKDRIDRLITGIDKDQEMGPPDNFAIIVKDWIDIDDENGNASDPEYEFDIGNGAETNHYQSLQPAYFSANTEIISPTELRLIKNMNEKFYIPITTETSVLPIFFNKKPTNTSVNVNTASAKVLDALGFTPDAISNIIETRKDDPFSSIGAFNDTRIARDALITDSNPDGYDVLDVGVNSEYFLLEGKVEINNTRLFVNSILWRNNSGKVSVIMRDFSNPKSISKAKD